MAKLSDLVLDVATVFRIEEKTVSTYARHLREAGMLSQGGRGRNAPDAVPMDAARLLIAMSVPGHAKDSPEAATDFGKLVFYSANESEERPELRIGPFLHLAPRCTLEAALAAIIAAYGDDEKCDTLANGSRFYAGIRCRIYPALTAATINIHLHEYNFHHLNTERMISAQGNFRVDSSEVDYAEFNAASDEFSRLHDRYFRGIRQTAELAGPELSKIGEMLTGSRDPGHVPNEAELLEAARWAAGVGGNDDPP